MFILYIFIYVYINVIYVYVYLFIFMHVYVCLFYTYSREYKDQNDVNKMSKCEINFYFKALLNILSRKNKDIKVNCIIPKYKYQ